MAAAARVVRAAALPFAIERNRAASPFAIERKQRSTIAAQSPVGYFRKVERLRRLAGNRWLRLAAAVVPLAVSIGVLTRVPRISVLPLLPAVAVWAVGKYLLCPVRWLLVSRNGRGLWWHVRAYAEGELLGLASPGHVGADLWRAGRLVNAGMEALHAGGVIAVDRLIGGVALVLTGAVVGVTLPAAVAVPVFVVVAVAAVVIVVVRRRRPAIGRAWPGFRAAAAGVGLSMLYQVTAVALLVGAVRATGHGAGPLTLAALYAGSQLATLLPGLNGLSAREGALAAALVSTGAPWPAALGAVALVALVAWGPATLLGGSSLLVRSLSVNHRQRSIT